MLEGAPHPEKNPVEAILKQLQDIKFTTDRGSTYGFDNNGRIVGVQHQKGMLQTRYQRVEKGDITFFAQLDESKYRALCDVFNEAENRIGEKIHIIELSPDDKPRIVKSLSEVSNPDNLRLAIQKKDGGFYTESGSLLPKKDATYFSFRYQEDENKKGEGTNMRFLGKVDEVSKKD